MAAVPDTLRPVVTSLRPETFLVPFTDYSQWERKRPARSSLHTPPMLSPLSAPRVRKTSKSTAPAAKKQSTGSTTAKVRLQPIAMCAHGQGVRRKPQTVSISDKVKETVTKSPEKPRKSGRLLRSHEPTNIRLLRVNN